MTTATTFLEYQSILIGGDLVEPSTPDRTTVINPTTEEPIGSVPAGSAADVDLAVESARDAFHDWSQTSIGERVGALTTIAAALETHATRLTEIIVADLGMPKELTHLMQVLMAVETFKLAAQVGEAFPFESRHGQAIVRHDAAGVVAAVTPWNFPLAEIATKTAYALAAGCTVVIKPSDLTPLAALEFAAIVGQTDLPAGVVNVVAGGADAGLALVNDPRVDLISFTGSTEVGRAVGQAAAKNITRVQLELGGKSACVLFPDADLDKAIPDTVFKAFLNSGQVCSALSRLVVPRSRMTEIEERVAAVIDGAVVGDPTDSNTQLGPLVSANQQAKVASHIEAALSEGAKLVAGGPGRPAGLEKGYFARPTAFSEVTTHHRLAREEVFGPVLAIMPYEGEEEAVRIAEDSEYGLATGLWTADPERAMQLARRLRSGQVEINGGCFDPLAPFGGFKHSGIGRSCGQWGLADFTELKSILPQGVEAP